MKETILLLKQEFESSSGLTADFAFFYHVFRKEFKRLLRELGAEKVKINRGHFTIYGFFQIKDQIWFFDLGDIRWEKDFMMIRTAESFDDYTGGSNKYVGIRNSARFIRTLTAIVGGTK